MIPFQMENSWYSGEAELTSFELEELLGTKLRALYERKKGRDLFNLHYAKQHASIDTDRVLQCYQHYVKTSAGKPPTKKQFLQNLEEKVADPAFEGDLEGLLRPGIEYDQEEAFEWVKEALIEGME